MGSVAGGTPASAGLGEGHQRVGTSLAIKKQEKKMSGLYGQFDVFSRIILTL